ncbi:MAG: Stk1 family PASTA domain-containing Ser/Thr kinase [Tissierellia bacterium]|nr:Stk1 family PASTA domain-containing Ser/Thr kinase [Tissierellia bacterium]
MAEMMNLILAERYECLEQIGSGGMGDVYKAHDRRLDRIVAIKILKSEYNQDDNFIRKFRRESLAAASISHPNIVSIYDVGMDVVEGESLYYIVMEYIDGKTLRALIQEEGRLSQNAALNYLIQIAEALKVAHSKNIVHRDIKSQNIMITRDNRVKVTDFGIARMAGNQTVTVTTSVMGSVHYFSPEQARGQKVDHRSDIYSMGVVLYEMLTGEVPFESDNPVTVALMHVQNQIPLPSSKNPAVTVEVDQIFSRMTEKKVQDRYDNVMQIIDDVKAILLGKKVRPDYGPVTDRTHVMVAPPSRPKSPTGPRPPIQKKKKSNALPMLGGALLAIFLLVGLVFGAGHIRKLVDSSESDTVEMLSFIGRDISEAEEFALEQELYVEILDFQETDDKDPGTILEQNVEAGSVLNKGDTVGFVVAESPEPVYVEVPSLANLTVSEAQDSIEELGLRFEVASSEFSDEVPADRIISQEPESGKEVAERSTIRVILSKGPDARMTVVPNLKGVTVEKAKELLAQQGLILGDVSEQPDITVGTGEVVWQQYDSGNQLKQGTTVDIIISSGFPKPPTPDDDDDDDDQGEEKPEQSLNLNLSLSDDGQEHEISVVRKRGGKEQIVDSRRAEGGSSLSIPVKGRAGDVFDIYVDGKLMESEKVGE